MNFTKLNMKLIEDNGFCDVLIRVDEAFSSEFGEEFMEKIIGPYSRHAEGLREQVQKRFPDRNLRRARVVLYGMTLATVPLISKEEERAQNTRHFGLISEYAPISEEENDGRLLQDYIVKDGDTLWIIAAKFNTSGEVIAKINGLEGSLEVGRRISVPMNVALVNLD
ncbi:MAG: LysM peptidoglycan-binding domain-containing protein [Defluviitaleaceae bacterium]|nr:LysM peptidoglycan-binding domain-containing protein [Defluviitaleaceae bacterium]